MSGPLHVELVAIVERHRRVLAFQFIGNHAVVDARDRGPHAVALVKQPAAIPLDLGGVNRANAPHLLGDHEVGPRLLPARLDLHQHHVLRIVTVQQRLSDQVVIRRCGQAAERHAQ